MNSVDRILVIDDDVELCSLVSEYLRPEGFQVESAHDGNSGLNRALSGDHMLVVLDVMLPRLNGFDVLRKLRDSSRIPVLLLTARGEDVDRIVGLEIGADDYLPKPFNPRELLARLKAILRRRGAGTHGAQRMLRFGRLEIDPGSRSLAVDGRECALTSYQFDLLVALAENAGRVLSREQLMEMVRGAELEAFDRSIDVHISRIRAAIEDDPKHPRRIVTVRGLGYVFARVQDDER
jgi:DNA-binding response OmpR family regulator